MAPYIYGVYNGAHVIDLNKSVILLERAAAYLASVASKDGKILFVGTKPVAREALKEAAKSCDMPYVSHHWPGGLLTNYKTLRASVKRLYQLRILLAKGGQNFKKRERLQLEIQKERLERAIGGIENMGGLPDAIFIIDIGYEKIALSEAKKLMIPVVGVVDTNNDPSQTNYPITGNDESLRAIKLYLKIITTAISKARSASGVFRQQRNSASIQVKNFTKKGDWKRPEKSDNSTHPNGSGD